MTDDATPIVVGRFDVDQQLRISKEFSKDLQTHAWVWDELKLNWQLLAPARDLERVAAIVKKQTRDLI